MYIYDSVSLINWFKIKTYALFLASIDILIKQNAFTLHMLFLQTAVKHWYLISSCVKKNHNINSLTARPDEFIFHRYTFSNLMLFFQLQICAVCLHYLSGEGRAKDGGHVENLEWMRWKSFWKTGGEDDNCWWLLGCWIIKDKRLWHRPAPSHQITQVHQEAYLWIMHEHNTCVHTHKLQMCLHIITAHT